MVLADIQTRIKILVSKIPFVIVTIVWQPFRRLNVKTPISHIILNPLSINKKSMAIDIGHTYSEEDFLAFGLIDTGERTTDVRFVRTLMCSAKIYKPTEDSRERIVVEPRYDGLFISTKYSV